MKPLLFTLLILLSFSKSYSQAPTIKQWDYRYGGDFDEQLLAFEQTSDGGFILGGYTRSEVSGDRTEPLWSFQEPDYWIVKTDSFGVKQWEKRFGGIEQDYLTALKQTPDGGFILGGYSNSPMSGDKSQNQWGGTTGIDYWVIKINALGVKQWDKRFGGPGLDILSAIQPTADGGYILGGWSSSENGGDKTDPCYGCAGILPSEDYWVVKINALGIKEWDKIFGGNNEDWLTCLKQTTDGGYIFGGIIRSGVTGSITESTRGGVADYWVVKTNALGVKQWDKRIGGNKADWLYSIEQTADKGYLLSGASNSDSSGEKSFHPWGGVNDNDYWVVKIDSGGSKQWDKRFGGTYGDGSTGGTYYGGTLGSLSKTSDGGFLIAGLSTSIISGDKTENNLGGIQGWIVKTDVNGNKQWDKTIFSPALAGGQSVIARQTNDGCYAIANYCRANIGGYKSQLNWDTTNTSTDYWFVKLCDTANNNCNLTPAVVSALKTTFCANDSTQICAPAGFSNYLWNTGQTGRCIDARLGGKYYVTVTDAAYCTAVSNHLTITVLPAPPVSITVNGDSMIAYNAVSYQWYLNGSAINGATSNVYIGNEGGSYTVAVTDSNGCMAVSTPILVSGIDNITDEDVVSVYPNPLSAGNWQLTVGNNFIGSEAMITDANGRTVFKSVVSNRQSEIALDVARGIYLLRISTSKHNVVRKLVKF